MTNKLNKILDFIVLDDEQNPVTNEQGLPTLLQGPIGAKDIPELIAKGKVENLALFAELQSKTEQWEWANKYYDYLVKLNEVEQYNASLPELVAADDGSLIEVEPKALPTEPQRPAVKTVDEVLAPYQKQIKKIQGIEFKGVHVSLNEPNQNGLSALKSALEIAKEFEVDDEFFPINFNAETCDGTRVLTLVNEAELKDFGLQFIMARKIFFE